MEFSKIKDCYFPYDTIRKEQDKLIESITDSLSSKKNILIHAPTGLGKTAAALGPALKKAMNDDLVIFFLTSRHTQHKIAIDTLRLIKEKHNLDFGVADIIGKKWMCLQPGIEKMNSAQFNEFCKSKIEDGLCEYYSNLRVNGKETVIGKKIISEVKDGLLTSEEIIDVCLKEKICPYEVSMKIARNAKVIIGDYYYIFHPKIINTFMNKIGKKLEESIIIVDEGHNLPDRVRDLLSTGISNITLSRAYHECRKYEFPETLKKLEIIEHAIENISLKIEKKEELVTKEEFLVYLRKHHDVETFIGDLEEVAEMVRENQTYSYIGVIANFIITWLGEDEGFVRIIAQQYGKRGTITSLKYNCLDPSVITEPIFKKCYSTILMSGTLMPVDMYKDVLGFSDNDIIAKFESPFPEENKINLIVPQTSTKYTMRSEDMYQQIASIVAKITNLVPGNSAVFFPSYKLRDDVVKYYTSMGRKTMFTESPELTKAEKEEMLEKFKQYQKAGAVLLGVSSGSFGEGIDLPGDLLKCVIVVGLPLGAPDLLTKELIAHYDDEFQRGWDYGYMYPALNKIFQSAGRCIRSETDKGVVVFLDIRFTWPRYFNSFPEDWKLKISNDYETVVDEFFNKTKN